MLPDFALEPPGRDEPILEPVELGEPPLSSEDENYLLQLDILGHVAEYEWADIFSIDLCWN